MSTAFRHLITAAIAVHSCAVVSTVAVFAATAHDWIGGVGIALWVVAGVAVGIVLCGVRPRDSTAIQERMSAPQLNPLWTVAWLLPLCQALAGGAAAMVVIATGHAPNVDYLLIQPGFGGQLLTVVILVLVAYLAALIGLLLALMVWLPLLVMFHIFQTRSDGRLMGRLALPGLLISILPMAISGVLAIDGPSGRGAVLPRFLMILGVDVDRFSVADHGWLWTARTLTVLCVVCLVVATTDQRKEQAVSPRSSADKRQPPKQRKKRPHGRPRGGRRR